MRRRSFAFSDNHRVILNRLISQLGIPQKRVADECGISQGWLSQLLSGKRLGAERDQVAKINAGLHRLLEKYTGDDKETLSKEIQDIFSIEGITEQHSDETVESMRVAADLMVMLSNRCLTKSMRRQVIEFLKTAIEQ